MHDMSDDNFSKTLPILVFFSNKQIFTLFFVWIACTNKSMEISVKFLHIRSATHSVDETNINDPKIIDKVQSWVSDPAGSVTTG